MALAGIHIWVIQLFGRWGSSTVLRYTRDALLGRRGGGLGRAVSVADRLVQEDLQGRLGIHPGPPGGRATHAVRPAAGAAAGAAKMPAHKVVEVLERIAAAALPKLVGDGIGRFATEAATNTFNRVDEARLAAVEGMMNVWQGDRPPPYVQNPAVGGKLHIGASWTHTRCGWRWGPGGGVPRMTSEGAGAGPLCRKCGRGG